MTRAATRWLLTALGALVAAWMFAPAVVPVYDGLSQPDEPYRYVVAPAGAKPTKPPTTARATFAASGGVSRAGYANSGESGPQISVYFPAGAMGVPSSATSITVTATPQAPQPPLPENGSVVSNVYAVSATAGGSPLSIVGKGNQEPTLQMRAPSGRQPGPVFEHRSASGGWQPAKTIRVGYDIYQTQMPDLGDWALVQTQSAGAAQGGRSTGGGMNGGLLAGGIAILAVAGIIVTIRTVRARKAAT